MFMEPKSVEKLISLIKYRPAIYGPRPKRGKKKHQKLLDELWKEVATEMNRSVRECKLKWTTLRNCYARLLREERSHKVKKRHWHLRNEMNFLRGHIQPYAETRVKCPIPIRALSSRTKIKIPTDSSKTNFSFDEDNFAPSIPDQSNEDISINNPIPNQPVHDFVIVETETSEQPLNSNCSSWQQGRNSPQEDNETISCYPVIDCNPFSLPERMNNENTEDNVCQPKNNKDEQSEGNILFLRSLLPDINKLSDRKQRIFKRKTLEVLENLFDEGDFNYQRDENNYIRQCQISRSNYNAHQQQHAHAQQQHAQAHAHTHTTVVSEKFIQKVEPRSP